jgi:hypothetical protein
VPFPLERDLQLAKDLHPDLPCIKSGFNEVVSTKQLLAEQPGGLMQALKAAKQTWIEASIRTGQQPSAPPHPHGGPPEYKSGQWSTAGPAYVF